MTGKAALEFPDSVEEAAALLGATITRFNVNAHKEAILPPKGMHPAFAISKESCTTDLVSSLYILRTMLRTTMDKGSPLVSAPSILQVLKKLLGISTQLASAAAAIGAGGGGVDTAVKKVTGKNKEQQQEKRLLLLKHRCETPPMSSTACRRLWVDCVVLCHSQSQNTGELTQFLRQMLSLASIHPRSAKAGGGVRIAALSVVAALFEDFSGSFSQNHQSQSPKFVLASQLAPWSLDVLQVCLRALRSAGHGEPTYREAAIRAACATATACRNAAMKNRKPSSEKEALVLQGAMEDRAVAEAIKVMRQAASDKFPEVRSIAATFAAVLAPVLVSLSNSVDQLMPLEEVLHFAIRNIDDECPFVADQWAEAVARCISTAIQYNETSQASERSNPDQEDTAATAATPPSARFKARKPVGLSHTLKSLKQGMEYLVNQFIRVGGELAASRCGGAYSAAGRAVRMGYCLALVKLLRLQSVLGAIGDGRSISMKDATICVLAMAGPEMEKQLSAQGLRTKSKADPGLVRLYTGRVLRQGLYGRAIEPVQASLLQELLALLEPDIADQSTSSTVSMNANQKQIILIETSNLLASLGEAFASKIEEVVGAITTCLSHSDGGVRHEAAIAMSAVAASFPNEGRAMVQTCIDEIQENHSKLVSAARQDSEKTGERGGGMRMFRRSPRGKVSQTDSCLPCQFSIHGRALALSMLIHDLPELVGGLPRDLVSRALAVAEVLNSSQVSEFSCGLGAESACICVRSGYSIVSGVLATGPEGVESHVPAIMQMWKKTFEAAREGGKTLAEQQDLDCLDAALSSVVVFLKFCSELLLAIPEALNKVTILLEGVFALLQPSGRLGSADSSSAVVASRMESATASLLEAFAWLPSGSFPIIADEVFSCAATHIRKAVENDIKCSVLYSLVTKEDSILDSKTLNRSDNDGQVGDAKDIAETIVSLTADICLQRERESVLHLNYVQPNQVFAQGSPGGKKASSALERFANDDQGEKPPTPLHEVGTWRRPFDPSSSSRVRVVDAAIQAFSATFGLKDGKDQQGAVDLLESLVPPLLAQLARTIGINSTSTELDRRSKGKEDSAAVANITAVLLSCLQALPLHEATHNIPIGLGPPWMNKAKDLLLTLLPSGSSIVRRAAAQGLALLATLGVTEDAHFLQSSLLHSLDEVMQGNKPDGKTRAIALEPVSAARAGSLLTLACIQRTAHNVAKRKAARARGRVSGSKSEAAIDKSNEDLPLLQMMTRILPSAACHGFITDYFAVKTHAIHSFAVLLSYSSRLNAETLSDEDQQLLRKAVELVDDNFSVSWTAVSSIDVDKGQESEKMAAEVAFLAVLLRLMTFLLPFLVHLREDDEDIARRFSVMASIMLENHGSHPSVFLESMAFYDVLLSHPELVPKPNPKVLQSETPIFSCFSSVLSALSPARPSSSVRGSWYGCSTMGSTRNARAAAFVARKLSSFHVSARLWEDMKLAGVLLASLEAFTGTKTFCGGSVLRSVASSRDMQRNFAEENAVENEIFLTLPSLLICECSAAAATLRDKRLLRWILFVRQILSPFSVDDAVDEAEGSYDRNTVVASATLRAVADAREVYSIASHLRWQVKCLAAQVGAGALKELRASTELDDVPVRQGIQFYMPAANSACSRECGEANRTTKKIPNSKLIFHLEDILSSACMSAVATLDQAELCSLQSNSVILLHELVECFGNIPDPEDASKSILNQFSTQILSSVKHAIGAPNEITSDLGARLFVAGCEALPRVAEAGLLSDASGAKRLLRPLIPRDETLPVFRYEGGIPKGSLFHREILKSTPDSRSAFVIRLASVWIIGEVLLQPMNVRNTDDFTGVMSDVLSSNLGFAVHSAVMAIDGAGLLRLSSLSLVGLPTRNVAEEVDKRCAFLYRNLDDIDDFIKLLLVAKWSSCGRSAVKPLLDEFASSDHERSLLLEWLNKLVPLFLSGVYDGIGHLVSGSCDYTENAEWAREISASLVLDDCLVALTCLSKAAPDVANGLRTRDEFGKCADFLCSSVLLPILDSNAQTDREKVPESCFDLRLVSSVCSFVSALVDPDTEMFEDRTSLLVCLLKMLDYLETENLNINDNRVEEAITCSLTGVGCLIRKGYGSELVVKAMIRLTVRQIFTGTADLPARVIDAGKSLFSDCLAHNCITTREKEKIAHELAVSGSWDTWAVVSIASQGATVPYSLETLQRTMTDVQNVEALSNMLAAVRSLIQDPVARDSLTSSLLSTLGADILNTFVSYGTMQIPNDATNCRSKICADALKVILAAYHRVSEAYEEQDIAEFLATTFEFLLSVIRFNGLPNHASPEAHSDSMLGRISAQAILHVARTTPIPFKSCVAMLGDKDRVLLEFAVRGEMTGYANTEQQQAPSKKKLSLKGFKKNSTDDE